MNVGTSSRPSHGAMTMAGVSIAALAVSGAHFLRQGDVGMAAAWWAIVVLVVLRRGWARWVVAVALAIGVDLWTGAGIGLVAARRAMEEPWIRLALILGVVLLAHGAALIWTVAGARGWYARQAVAGNGEPMGGGGPQAIAFLLAASLLWMARANASVPVLLADRYAPGWGALEIVGLGVYAAWVCGLMLDPARSASVRSRIWLFFSVVFFGQLALGLAGMERMLMTGRLHLPVPALIVAGPLFRGHGLFMLILFSSTLLLAGPAWCSHFCYVGAWDDALCRAGGKRPRPLPRRAHWLRGVALLLVAGAAVGLRMAGADTATAAIAAGLFGLGGVAVMVWVSRRAGIMAHCTAYCPMGLLSNLFGRMNPWRIRISAGCDGCGRCSRACRYGALSPRDLSLGRPGITCTLCGDCVSRCRDGRLQYAFPGLASGAARTAFIVVVTAVHAVFLGVARI